MSNLIIMQPFGAAYGGSNVGNPARVATPDPKEAAAVQNAGSAAILIDLGIARIVDTMFFGYTGGGDIEINFAYSVDGVSYANIAVDVVPAVKNLDDRNRHYLAHFAGVTARYFQFYINSAPANWQIGVAAVGKAWQPAYGHEWGSGRSIIDTGSATRLKSGGFGIDEGVTAGGWQFTVGDLTDAEVDYLYELLRGVGIRGTMLVVEDPELPGIGHNKIHWGIFQRLDYYERVSRDRSRWSLKIEEWA